MKNYLQPAATFALALAIGSLPFTLPSSVNSQVNMHHNGGPYSPIHVKVVDGCK